MRACKAIPTEEVQRLSEFDADGRSLKAEWQTLIDDATKRLGTVQRTLTLTFSPDPNPDPNLNFHLSLTPNPNPNPIPTPTPTPTPTPSPNSTPLHSCRLLWARLAVPRGSALPGGRGRSTASPVTASGARATQLPASKAADSAAFDQPRRGRNTVAISSK